MYWQIGEIVLHCEAWQTKKQAGVYNFLVISLVCGFSHWRWSTNPKARNCRVMVKRRSYCRSGKIYLILLARDWRLVILPRHWLVPGVLHVIFPTTTLQANVKCPFDGRTRHLSNKTHELVDVRMRRGHINEQHGMIHGYTIGSTAKQTVSWIIGTAEKKLAISWCILVAKAG